MLRLFHRTSAQGFVFLLFMNLAHAAFAQQTTVLDAAASALQLAATDPDTLASQMPKRMAVAKDRDIYLNTIAPCFQKMHDIYQARIPDLMRQLELVRSTMGNTNGTQAQDAVSQAESSMRALNIAKMAIVNPVSLRSDPEFQMNANLRIVLIQQLRVAS